MGLTPIAAVMVRQLSHAPEDDAVHRDRAPYSSGLLRSVLRSYVQ